MRNEDGSVNGEMVSEQVIFVYCYDCGDSIQATGNDAVNRHNAMDFAKSMGWGRVARRWFCDKHLAAAQARDFRKPPQYPNLRHFNVQRKPGERKARQG